MRASLTKLWWVAVTLIAVTSCEVTSEAPKEDNIRGGEGESCTSRRDCEDGLACVDNRCSESGHASSEPDSGMSMPVADTRGAEGESCTQRADCRTGNACIDNVCVSEDNLPMGMTHNTRGDRGESCRARNDCQNGLACINQICLDNDFMLDVQPKECVRVQCEETADCCATFVEPYTCTDWRTACDGGNASACETVMTQCTCQLVCTGELCLPNAQCTTDVDCGLSLPHCFGGQCSQCGSATDCTAGQQCLSGVCQTGCTSNEQCPLFYACDAGQCIESGCQSARECYFATRDARSECVDGDCVTPCSNDAECGELQACDDGSCRFVGCQSDEECRIYLGLVNQLTSDRALCRAPEP